MKDVNLKLCLCTLCTFLLGFTLQARDIKLDPQVIQMIQASSMPRGEGEDVEGFKRDLAEELIEKDKSQWDESEHPLFSTEDEELVENDFSAIMASYYATTHRAAYHQALNISVDGSDIELEDKSIWQVIGWSQYKVKTWSAHHALVIAPNKNIFTRWAYPFKIINLDTHDVVKAKMKLTPVFNDPNIDIHVHWIEDIDYQTRLIRLEDGSIWSINWFDGGVMKSFGRYNIVIVGTNDGWFRGSNPNILICIANHKYIRGKVIN